MKKWDLTLFGWFVILVAVIFLNSWWFPLDVTWKAFSLLAALTGSSMLLFNYHLKAAGKQLLSKEFQLSSRLDANDQKMLARILRTDRSYRSVLILLAVIGVAYVVALVSALRQIEKPEQLYLYLVGWAIWCLILDFQIRLHLACGFIRKLLSRSEDEVQPVSKQTLRKVHG